MLIKQGEKNISEAINNTVLSTSAINHGAKKAPCNDLGDSFGLFVPGHTVLEDWFWVGFTTKYLPGSLHSFGATVPLLYSLDI